jgi:undecaprenyl diphosphate synthase
MHETAAEKTLDPQTLPQALDPAEDKRLRTQLKAQGELPRHIAIIMDGDRRWATENNLPKTEGHLYGRESVRDIVRACGQLGVSVLTLYTFSTENWSRPKTEVAVLMRELHRSLRQETKELNENNVRLKAIGRLGDLPRTVRLALREAQARTNSNTGLQLNLALNYGGRSELVDAFQNLAAQVKRGDLAPKDIDEETVSQALYTAGQPDPDLLIRSSGEMRLSNFLPWQLTYAELWFTEVHWPAFRRQHLYQAIGDYQHRQRRFGGA